MLNSIAGSLHAARAYFIINWRASQQALRHPDAR